MVCLGSERAAGPVKGPRARRESKALRGAMAAQEVIDRVNEEELRGTTAIVGEDTSDCWIKYLKAKGMKTVSRLLNHEGGVMKTTGTDEVKAAKKWATFMKTDGDEKKQRDEAEEADDVGRWHAPGEWEDMEWMVGGAHGGAEAVLPMRA